MCYQVTQHVVDNIIVAFPSHASPGTSQLYKNVLIFQILQIAVDALQYSKLEQSSHGRTAQDETLKRLQTPGGSGEQTIPFSTWSQNQSTGGHYNPFEDNGKIV